MSQYIQSHEPNHQAGFSLLELAIVLTIMGLLIISIFAGTSMVKEAELKSVMADIDRYRAAYSVFVTRYNKMPGDSDAMYTYFGDKCADTADHCNGDNNGMITIGGNNNEINKAWKHLQLAGLITTRIDILDGSLDTKIGTSVPASNLSKSGYMIITSTLSGSPYQSIVMGKEYLTDMMGFFSATLLYGSTLTPRDSFYLDHKMDDGWIDADGNFLGAMTGAFTAMDGLDQYDGVVNTARCSSAAGYYNNMDSKIPLCVFATKID